MTSDRCKSLALIVTCALGQACALSRPPAPEEIDCDEIDRAEERFPDECGDRDPDAGAEGDAAASAQPDSGE